MAHHVKIDGTVYEIPGGTAKIDAAKYIVKKGKALVDGTAYDINLYDYTDINNVVGVEMVAQVAYFETVNSNGHKEVLEYNEDALSRWKETYGTFTFSEKYIEVTHSYGSPNGYMLEIWGLVYVKSSNGKRLGITDPIVKNAFSGSFAATQTTGYSGTCYFQYINRILGLGDSTSANTTVSFPGVSVDNMFFVAMGRYSGSGSCYSRVGISSCTLNGVSIPVSTVNEI